MQWRFSCASPALEEDFITLFELLKLVRLLLS